MKLIPTAVGQPEPEERTDSGGAHPNMGCGTSTGGSGARCRTTWLIKHLPSRFIQTISKVRPLQSLLQHISSDLECGQLFQH